MENLEAIDGGGFGRFPVVGCLEILNVTSPDLNLVLRFGRQVKELKQDYWTK